MLPLKCILTESPGTALIPIKESRIIFWGFGATIYVKYLASVCAQNAFNKIESVALPTIRLIGIKTE